MATGSGGIRAGRAFVEIGGTNIPLKKVLVGASAMVQKFAGTVDKIGDGLKGIGEKVLSLGVAASAGLGLGVKTFADFESAMAELRANAKPTEAELVKIAAAINDISKNTGAGPTTVVKAMTELAKAGMSIDSILGGVTETVLKFAKVAGIDAAVAATVLTDALNVFGVDATTAVDTLSRAADASSISLEEVVQSFAQVSAVAKLAGLTIGETANAIAILGQAGVKGSDAGTSLKTMLLKLLAPAEDGAKAIKEFGINVRNADHTMKPLRGIIEELQNKLKGMNDEARDEALRRLFGTDAIRAASILLSSGATGIDEFTTKMQEGLPVAEKFAVLMNTLAGFGAKAMAAMERLGVTVGGILMPALGKVAGVAIDFFDSLELAIKANPQLITDLAKMAGGAIVLGGALVAVGASLGTVASVITALSTPLGMIGAALAAGAGLWLAYTDGGQKAIANLLPTLDSMKTTAVQTFSGIADALKGGDLALAGKIFWAGLKVEWLKGTNYLMGIWTDFKLWAVDVWIGMGFEAEKIFTNAFSVVQKTWAYVVSEMTGSFGSAVSQMAVMLVNLMSPLAGVLAKVFGIDIKKQVEAAANIAFHGESDAAKKKRAQDLANEEGRIESNRQTSIGRIDEAQQLDYETRHGSADPETERRKAALQAAQDELNALRGEASVKAGAVGEAKRVSPGGGVQAAKAIPSEGEIAAGVNAAAKKVDVRGTFNARTLGGMSAGESVNSMLEKQIKAQEKANDKLDKINRTIERSGVVT